LFLAPFLLGFISPVFADLGEANLNSDETYKEIILLKLFMKLGAEKFLKNLKMNVKYNLGKAD